MGKRHKTVLAVSPDRQLAQWRQAALTGPDFTLCQFTPKAPHVTKYTSVDAEFCCCVTNSIPV
jgi:hypothetical protein